MPPSDPPPAPPPPKFAWLARLTQRLRGEAAPRLKQFIATARSAGLRRWAAPVVLFALAVFVALILLGKMKREVWMYYTDDQGTRATVQEDKTRYVLWEDPKLNPFQEERALENDAPDSINQPGGRLEAAFSPNGTMMVLVRWDDAALQTNADLYLSHWDGRVWSRPEPIPSLNTPAHHERGPAFSPNGRFLYFSSDRPGGTGGYDLYVAAWNGESWGDAAPLGPEINSAGDESGPALAPDNKRLFFSSNRDGSREDDIYVANRLPPTGDDSDPPRFAAAEAASHLNSRHADVQAALNARGSHVFIASDRDRTSRAGYRIYFSRVVDGVSLPPEQVDLYLPNGNVTDPAVRMDGFDLLFSSDHESASQGQGKTEDDYRLYRSTTREVIGYTDLSRWEQFKELMDSLAWWIFLALAALLALIYLLEKWRDISSLFHKCLAGSAVAHLLLLLLMMVWLIARELQNEDIPPPDVVNVTLDALAEEELALESVPEETELTQPDLSLPAQKLQADFNVPDFKPQNNPNTVPVDAEFQNEAIPVQVSSTKAEPVEDHQMQPVEESSLLSELSATTLPEPEQPVLEERDLANAPEPAQPVDDPFRPAQVTPATAEPAEPREVADNAAAAPTDPAKIEPAASVNEDPSPTPLTEVRPEQADQSAVDAPKAAEPLASELLADLPDSAPLAPANPQLEEPGQDAPGTPANSAGDLFQPGPSLGEVAGSPADSPGAAGDPDASQADSTEVAGGSIATTPAEASAAPAPAPAPGEAPADSDLPGPAADAGPRADLPETALLDPGAPLLDEGDRQAAPADSSGDLFQPTGAPTASNATPAEKGTDDPVENRSASADVATNDLPPSQSPGTPAQPAAEAQPDPSLPGASALPSNLPTTALLDPGAPLLDEGDRRAVPAESSGELFQPTGAPTASNATPAQKGTDDPVENPSAAADVAATDLPPAQSPGTSAQPAGEAQPDPSLPGASALASNLPTTALLDPGAPLLDEGDRRAAPADSAGDLFQPTGAPTASNATSAKMGTDDAVENRSATSDVATTDLPPSQSPGTSAQPAPEAQPGPSLPGASALASNLPTTALLDPGAPLLDEGDRQAGAPANSSGELFEPGSSQLVATPAQGPASSDAAASAQLEVSKLTGAGLVTDHQNLSAPLVGLEASESEPTSGRGGLPAPSLDPSLAGSLLPGELEAPADPGNLTDFLKKQRGRPSLDVIKQLGGSDGTETAIRASIKWLAENQEEDGHWNARKHGAKGEFDTGVTGLALLCFYGWGARHDQEGNHREHVDRALQWLIAQQTKSGDLSGGGLMYCHSIASIALCEAYGITKDPLLREPAERSIVYTLAAQSKTKGGWRYHPGNDSDTSITGWQYMAIHSARLAGLEVPEESFELARRWLNRAGGGKFGGLYGYQAPARNSPAMVATGMFCRQLDLLPPSDPKQAESAGMLKMHPMKSRNLDFYYIYYATLALYQHQGSIWDAWNERLKEIVPLTQIKTGSKTGSWNPSRGLAGNGGRVASTTLATLSLEVYYRLLPIYGFRGEEETAPGVKVKTGEPE